jgi:hypothetical protein
LVVFAFHNVRTASDAKNFANINKNATGTQKRARNFIFEESKEGRQGAEAGGNIPC